MIYNHILVYYVIFNYVFIMNINNYSLITQEEPGFFSGSIDMIPLSYHSIRNMGSILFESTCKVAKNSMSLGLQTIRVVQNPFFFAQLRNSKKLSYSDISQGIWLLQTYLKFKLSKEQHLAAQEIKQNLINQFKEKCTKVWGFEWITQAITLGRNREGEFQEWSKLAKDPSFQKVLALAANPIWGMLVKHMKLGFHVVAPLEWQMCIHTFLDFINKATRNQLDEKIVINLIETIINSILKYRPSDNLEFILFLFPEITQLIQLILENPKNIALLIPLLLGSKQIPSTFCPLQFVSFSQYIEEYNQKVKSKEDLQRTFLAWLKQESQPIKPLYHANEVLPTINHERIEGGRTKLESIHQDLLSRNETLQIGIVLEYDQNQTTFNWLKKVLEEKLKALDDKYGDLTQLQWKITLIDARENGNQGLIDKLNHYLAHCSLQYKNITFQHLTHHQIVGKAEAVKFGLNQVCSSNDIVGFIDLSNKINILEIGHLIASIYEDCKKGNEGVAIGSRRMGHVENKAFTFLLRSMGLNWIVKAMFPLLYPLTDTQTGFKFFSKNAWANIQKSGLYCTTLAFDIEILQQAARLGLEIKEFPVDFYDNTQHREGEIEEDKIAVMLKELFAIRSSCSDSPFRPFEEGEGRLLAGGAEHMVFTLEDGSLVKIPHEQYDPHLFGLLKHVIFKNREKMEWEDQDKKLISSDSIKAILDHPKLSGYIQLLRGNKEFNIFVMKVIANIENKSYQSLGYEISEKLGRDLVIPFCFVEEPFSLKLDNQWRTFSSFDQVKRTVSAHKIVKNQLVQIIEDSLISDREKEAKILLLIDEAIDLFKSLWKRGIFDLDANIMNDMGYCSGSHGQERLMVLDPGEMLNDPSKINATLLRKQVIDRYDFKELKILLKQLPERGDMILEQYQSKMMQFFDFIEEDLKKHKDLQIFGEDQKNEGSDFSLIMPRLTPLPLVRQSPIQQNKTMEYFKRSKNGFHVPYSRGIPPIYTHVQPSYPFFCCIPKDISAYPRSGMETLISTEKGSIGPTLSSLDQYDTNWLDPKTSSTLVILDAGSATRSSLLKHATERGTKGDLLLEGKPIYEHIAASFSKLLSSYLPEGYLVMASSDDLIHLSKSDCQALHDYFHPTNSHEAPGFFWSEIPNYKEKYLPHTVADTIKMIREPAIEELSGKFLKQIPVFKGAVQAGQLKPILQGISHILEKFAPSILAKVSQIDKKEVCEQGQIPGYATAVDLYQQLMQYQAAERLNGLKTPFFMIFKKEFLADFKKNILPLLPPSIYNDITWESILVRGIKMDKTTWAHSGKPSTMSSKEWENLWENIQKLKDRFHVNVDCPIQSSVRGDKLEWQNFDDPYSLFMFATNTYQPKTEQAWSLNKVKIVSDQKRDQNPGRIESILQGTIVILNSRIEGKVVIQPKKGKSAKNTHFESLFYGVELPAESSLHIPSNHLVVGIKGKIYSMKMGTLSKEKLKNKPVYIYDQDGRPSYFSSYDKFH